MRNLVFYDSAQQSKGTANMPIVLYLAITRHSFSTAVWITCLCKRGSWAGPVSLPIAAGAGIKRLLRAAQYNSNLLIY